MKTYSIIFFDGECSLCDKSVTFIIDRDPRKKFKFASIQSAIGKKLMQKHGKNPERVTSMYLIEGEKCWEASTAALKVAKGLSFPWSLLYGFIIIPPFVRDLFYYFAVSKMRNSFFGKTNTCRIMTPELAERFLDGEGDI